MKLVILGKDRNRIKEIPIGPEIKDELDWFLQRVPSEIRGKRNYLIPRENYDKIKTDSQRLLLNHKLASEIFSVLSAIETPEHTAVYFEE